MFGWFVVVGSLQFSWKRKNRIISTNNYIHLSNICVIQRFNGNINSGNQRMDWNGRKKRFARDTIRILYSVFWGFLYNFCVFSFGSSSPLQKCIIWSVVVVEPNTMFALEKIRMCTESFHVFFILKHIQCFILFQTLFLIVVHSSLLFYFPFFWI